MSSKKILIITGDAGESFEVLYAKQRMIEAGHLPVIAAPAVKSMNLDGIPTKKARATR